MGSTLKASAGILALGLATAVLVLAFQSLERGQGQPVAVAPTPAPTDRPSVAILVTVTWPAGVPTPTGTWVPFLTNLIITPLVAVTPGQRPSVIIDPTCTPPTPGPTYTPAPTSTPLPASGGPYLSEEGAKELAVRSCGMGVDSSIPPKAIFTTCKAVSALIGKGTTSAGSRCEREYWVVYVEGRFKIPGGPAGVDPSKDVYAQCQVVMDATTGEIGIWGLKNELVPAGAPYISEARAIEIGLTVARAPGNELNEAVPPRAILTAAKNINNVLGDPRPGGASERERWVVIFEGRFRDVRDPPPPPGYRYESPDLFQKLYVVIEAKSGFWHTAYVTGQLQLGELVKK